jgi:hypothetical protein
VTTTRGTECNSLTRRRKNFLGRRGVTPGLDEHIENGTLVIDRSPQVVGRGVDW